jgi:hypothetical protein
MGKERKEADGSVPAALWVRFQTSLKNRLTGDIAKVGQFSEFTHVGK